MLKLFLMNLLMLTYLGCVGTVEESLAPDTIFAPGDTVYVPYSGLSSVRAISHDKVEIEFFQAPIPGNVEYYLLVNNSTDAPLKLNIDALTEKDGGLLYYIVDGLDNANPVNSFKVRAVSQTLGVESENETTLYATLYDNTVANFYGIVGLELIPGQSDTSVRVKWLAPQMQGLFSASAYDPVHYEITYISEVGGAENLNNSTYTGNDKRRVLYPSPPSKASPSNNPSEVPISGLQPDTKYYFQVRAINQLYQSYDDNPSVTTIPVDKERNTKYMDITTNPSTSLFDFNQSGVVLANAAGANAFDKIDVFWQSGSGSFTGYRIFVKEYTGSSDPETDDQLTDAELISMNDPSNSLYTLASQSSTSKRISGLTNYKWYQVKVALCKINDCPVDPSDPNVAIISELKAIRVQPTLANFSGITSISNPTTYATIDEIGLHFDPVVTSQGYANALEFFCVDVANLASLSASDFYQFNDDYVSTINDDYGGATPASCDGLSMTGGAQPLDSYSSQTIKGLTADGNTQYCFAVGPAITGTAEEDRLSWNDLVIRCSYPEITVPSLEEFPGLSSCTPDSTSMDLSWQLPTGGIYSNFRVFWKRKVGTSNFSLNEAIDNAIDFPGGYDPYADNGSTYYRSGALANNVTTFRVDGLAPDFTYTFGVMAYADDGSTIQWSEVNTGTKNCKVPLPKVQFKEWNRVFAVGPKIDGRIPNDSNGDVPSNAYIYESVDPESIPYEVDTTTPANTFRQFPGYSTATDYNSGADANPNDGGTYMSNSGIVSLAFEHVDLTFSQTEFDANADNSVARGSRTYGYKIFRSSDNKASWEEVTQNGLLHPISYDVRGLPNQAPTTKSLVFFTDFGVQSLPSVDNQSIGGHLERARVYWYRIEVYFNGKLLSFDSTSGDHHKIKVTLPPPNMALVHRYMANKASCDSLQRSYDKFDNYSCDFNGVGGVAKGSVWQVGENKIDQRGDLLVDRNELGCNFTRGDLIDDPQLGSSYYDNGANPSAFADFNGIATVTGSRFKGCGQIDGDTYANGAGAGYPPSFSASYKHILQGDCIGRDQQNNVPSSTCSVASFTQNDYYQRDYMFPGATDPWPKLDCSNDLPSDPQTMSGRFLGAFSMNTVMQGEFLAVYYNSTTGGRAMPFEGPVPQSPVVTNDDTEGEIARTYDATGRESGCMINLAAIDSNNFLRARWMGVNGLENNLRFKGNYNTGLIDKTVAEITELSTSSTDENQMTLYSSSSDVSPSYQVPDQSLWNKSRFDSHTKLSRIMTSNAAKLPPLTYATNTTFQKICSNYAVQVGVANSSGSFLAFDAPKAKRPLSRKEFIVAAKWPETYSMDRITNLEKDNSINIASFDESVDNNNCSNNYRTYNGLEPNKGDEYSFLFTRENGTAATIQIPFITGSSALDDSTGLSTERCTSRFGIQDLVGNVMEGSTETLYCDYTQDTVFFGFVDGSYNFNLGSYQNNGDPQRSIAHFNTNGDVIETIRSIDGDLGQNAQITFVDASPAITNPRIWIETSIDAGYCSFTDTQSDTRTDGTRVFRDASGVFANIFNPDGTLNSNMIKVNPYDADSLYNYRDGNGYFQDFGANHLSPALAKNNSLALSASGVSGGEQANATAKYFNPIIGVPYTCQSGTCEDPILNGDLSDNKLYSTTYLSSNILVTDTTPPLGDFPIGNSQIFSFGISEVNFDYGEFRTYSNIQARSGNAVNRTFITDFVVDSPADLANDSRQGLSASTINANYTTLDDLQTSGVDEVTTYHARFNLNRGTSFAIYSGGSSAENLTGQYSAEFHNSNRRSWEAGSRCAVLINTDQ